MTIDPNRQALASVVLITTEGRALGNGFIVHTNTEAAYVLTSHHLTRGIAPEKLRIDGKKCTDLIPPPEGLDLVILKVPDLKARPPLTLANRAQTGAQFRVIGFKYDGRNQQTLTAEVELKEDIDITPSGSTVKILAWALDSFEEPIESVTDGAPLVYEGQASAILQVHQSGALSAISIAALPICWPQLFKDISEQLDKKHEDPPTFRYVLFTHITQELRRDKELINRLEETVKQGQCVPIRFDDTDKIFTDENTNEEKKEAYIKKASLLICIQGVHFDERNIHYMKRFRHRKGLYALIVGNNYYFKYEDIQWNLLGEQWPQREKFLTSELKDVLDVADEEKYRVYFDDIDDLHSKLWTILCQSPLLRNAQQVEPPESGIFALPTDPPKLDLLFGRADDLKRIDEWARSDSSAMLIWEDGGFGKTALVAQWLCDHAPKILPRHERIWWRYNLNHSTINDFLRQTNAHLDEKKAWDDESYREPGTLVTILKERPFILVIDGLERLFVGYDDPEAHEEPPQDKLLHFTQENEDAERLLEELSKLPHAKILLTTRRRPTKQDGLLNNPWTHKLPPISEAAARELLRARGAPDSMSDDDLNEIACRYRGNPQDIDGYARGQWSERRRRP